MNVKHTLLTHFSQRPFSSYPSVKAGKNVTVGYAIDLIRIKMESFKKLQTIDRIVFDIFRGQQHNLIKRNLDQDKPSFVKHLKTSHFTNPS